MTKYSNLECPLVSICVTVYNKELFIAQCLNSIINQTYTNLEIIVVYTHSTDNSLSIIKAFQKKDARIKVFVYDPQEDDCKFIRVSIANSYAYDLAIGYYVGTVDGDDLIEPTCVEECVNNIKDFGLIYTRCKSIGSINNIDTRSNYKYSKDNILNFFMVFHFRLFKRSLWDEIEHFDNIAYCWDYDLVLKLSEITNFIYLPRILYSWRRHENQLTKLKNLPIIKKIWH